MSEQPVAPADAPKNADKPAEGVHPGVANPDQPVFPLPYGVEVDTLKEMGVDHLHAGSGEVKEGESGGRPAMEPEGKPADPDADEKNDAAHKVAEANKVTAPAPANQQAQQAAAAAAAAQKEQQKQS